MGSAVGNYMFGGNTAAAAVPGEPTAAVASGPICSLETTSFLQCMNEVQNDFSRCEHIFDMFKQCHGARG